MSARGTGARAVLWLVFLVVFNLAFFVLTGVEHPVSVWIAYAFIHVAFLLMFLVPYLANGGSSRHVYVFALGSSSAVFFLVQLVVGIVVIALAPEDYKVSLVVQVVLLGISVGILAANVAANDHTAAQVERHESEVAFIKDVSARLKPLVGRVQDRDAARLVEKTYDVVHASPSRSTPAVASIERDIVASVGQLEHAVATQDVSAIKESSQQILDAAAQRQLMLGARG